MIGVERTEISSKTNAMNSSIVRGVAGLNMVKADMCRFETIVEVDVFKTRSEVGDTSMRQK